MPDEKFCFPLDGAKKPLVCDVTEVVPRISDLRYVIEIVSRMARGSNSRKLYRDYRDRGL